MYRDGWRWISRLGITAELPVLNEVDKVCGEGEDKDRSAFSNVGPTETTHIEFERGAFQALGARCTGMGEIGNYKTRGV